MNPPEKKTINPVTLAGFRDVLPASAIRKEDMINRLKRVFRRYGFCPIETPHLEYTDMLIGDSGQEIKKQLYRFSDNGNRDVTLRFDHTVPLARFITQHQNKLDMPFKRYVVGNVFRGETPQSGRYREFTQCDFDFVGTRSIAADAEVIQVIVDSLSGLGIGDFTVFVNHRKILTGFANWLGLEGRVPDFLKIIDKFDKIGSQKLSALLTATFGLDADKNQSVIEFMTNGKIHPTDSLGQKVLNTAKRYDHPLIREGVDELERLMVFLEKSGVPPTAYGIDWSIARGLDYYTGIVYETKLQSCPEIGSVASGGRYDNLTSRFSKKPFPGVGASIGLDRLIAAMDRLNVTRSRNTPADVLIGNLDARYLADSYKLANQLRNAGIFTEVYPSAEKISKLFKFADKKEFYFMIAFGETEATQSTYVVANLNTGEKIPATSIKELVTILQAQLKSHS